MQEPSSNPAESSPCCSGLRRYVLPLIATIIGCGFAYLLWPTTSPEKTETISGLAAFAVPSGTAKSTANGSSSPQANTKGQPNPAGEEDEDERMSRTIVGQWKTKRDSGPRDLVVKSDGTAKMTVNIDSTFGRILFQTKQMVMNIDWRIENSILHFKMVDGKPKTSVDLLMKGYGDSVAYPILECSEGRLLVKDGGGDPDHDWSRVVK